MTRAFLIGAGATRAQYQTSPLTHDFFNLLKIYRGDLYNSIVNTIKPYLPNRYGSNEKKSLNGLNVEYVMDSSEKFPISNKKSFLITLYLAIYELLAKPTESTKEDIKSAINGDITKAPTLFKTLINDERLSNEDFFMTLNYDLYLDREILSTQGKIDYGIKKEFLHLQSLPLNVSKNPSFSVYHLHGSLNWEFENSKQINVSYGAIRPKHSRLGSSLCLVPPGEKKFPSILKSIWETAEERLLASDELIIIGCSLNPHDTVLITLIKKFIDKKGISNVKIIFKPDPKGGFPISKKYDKVIGKGHKDYMHGFVINAPSPLNEKGAIEFIFDKGNN